MKNTTLLFFLLLSCNISFSQAFYVSDMLPLNDTFSFETLRFSRNEYGYGIMNAKGIVSKQKSLSGRPISSGKFENNIVCISYGETKLKKESLQADLINPKTGALIKTELICTINNGDYTAVSILNDPLNNFSYVITRQTNLQNTIFIGGNQGYKYLETSKLELISLDKNLATKKIELVTKAQNTFYGGACTDNNHNIYICSFSENSIVMEKFDSSGRLLSKLQSPFSSWKKPEFEAVIKYDNFSQNAVYITTSYLNGDKDNAANTLYFDFKTNKTITSGETLLNKNYKKNLKNSTQDADGKNFQAIGGLMPIQVLDDENRLIVIKEIITETPVDRTTQHQRLGSIISVYNKKTLELERDIVVDKGLTTFVENSKGIYGHLKGSTLYAVTSENSGLTSFKTFLYKIDITNGSVIKTEIEKNDAGKGWITYPAHIIWHKNDFIVPFIWISTFLNMDFKSSFQVQKYE